MQDLVSDVNTENGKALPIHIVSKRSKQACDLLRKISEESMCSVVADELIHEFFKSQDCG